MRMPWVVLLVACGTPAPATHDLPKPAVVAETTPPPIDAHVVDAPPPDAYVEPEPYEQKAAADRARADNLEKFPKPDIKPFGTPGDKARGIELLAAARKTKTDAIAAYRAVVDADPSNVDAYYELASAYARAGTPDIAIPLLGRLAVARHCDECSLVVAAAVHDDAWRTQWATEGFRDVLAAYATTPEGPHDPPDPAAPPVDPYVEAMQDHVTCAKGSRIKSKGDLSPGGTGEQWCEITGSRTVRTTSTSTVARWAKAVARSRARIATANAMVCGIRAAVTKTRSSVRITATRNMACGPTRRSRG